MTLSATTSSELAGVITDETGTGSFILNDSPVFFGTPIAPTAIAGTNSTQISTTAFVISNTDKYYSVNSIEEISSRATIDEVVLGMSLVSETGGTYALFFNSQYEIDPSDRTM